MYKLVRQVLFLISAEAAHHLSFSGLRAMMQVPVLSSLVRRWLRPRDPNLRVRAMGLEFPSPVGLAAGFDKNAVGYNELSDLGFGSIEVGTVTALGQPGNPRPRLFRLSSDRALINRMGFNNDGARAVSQRLRGERRTVLGVNVGKTKVVEEAGAIEDYRSSTRLLGPNADYFVVNVSSPNTPGLRALQAVDKLRPLLAAVRETLDEVAPHRVPLLVKIAPDLDDQEIDAVASLALELGLDGIIATNTTLSRKGLKASGERVAECGAGGLSGAPLKARALQVLRRLRDRTGDSMVLIAAGGIESPQDAMDRLDAGATLIQVYTGFVYGGPLFVHRLNQAIARRRARGK